MTRISRAMALRPVNSVKHVIDTSGLVSLGVTSTTDVYNTVDSPSAITNQVHVGASVKWVFVKIEIVGAVAFAGVPRLYMYMVKNPSAELTLPSPGVVGASSVKKFIIHQEMTMTAQTTALGVAFPRTMFRGVILIPKKYQRCGIEDKLQIVLGHDAGESSGTTRFCIQAIFKEFY